MTRDEAKKIVMIIKTAFPSWKPDDLTFTVNIWASMLAEYSYVQTEQALKVYIVTDSSGFAPSIGQVIAKMHVVEDQNELSEMEAWNLVNRAMQNGIYGSRGEFQKLPEVVRKAVGNPENLREWALTESRSVQTVIQSNFLRSFRQVTSRERELKRIPIEVRKEILRIQENGKQGVTCIEKVNEVKM